MFDRVEASRVEDSNPRQALIKETTKEIDNRAKREVSAEANDTYADSYTDKATISEPQGSAGCRTEAMVLVVMVAASRLKDTG